jgi:NitT/TauT family transport system ATP-binding protein
MSPHPGRIREEIVIPMPRPRDLSMVMEPEFIRLKRRILDLIHVSDDE